MARRRRGPGCPSRLPIGSTRSIVHAAGSASPFGHTLPRARTLPPPSVCTSSFITYQVSFFHGNATRDGALRLRLPRLQLETLVAAEQHQLVALRHDADVAHLPAALHRAHVGLDGVVAVSRWPPKNGRQRFANANGFSASLTSTLLPSRSRTANLPVALTQCGGGVSPAVLEVERPRQIRDHADARRARQRRRPSP